MPKKMYIVSHVIGCERPLTILSVCIKYIITNMHNKYIFKANQLRIVASKTKI